MTNEMTIFYIAVFMFFFCPVAIMVTGLIASYWPGGDQSPDQAPPPSHFDRESVKLVHKLGNIRVTNVPFPHDR